ncbi:Uncharacterised protein [Mycobacterium tuberculosis]|nr:Uncharacterised protein [Mycobacterium tuberculosis]
MYSTAPALIKVAKMVSADADGSMLKVPGAISPSIRRWSVPSSITGPTAQRGTDSIVGVLLLAAARRSATETQRWVPSRSTQVAREISANMPGFTTLVFMSVVSSS